jgi:hypothetical protein
MMNAIATEYYGDNTRWFMGRCIQNVAPNGLEGRIKVRIFGIHDDNVNNIPQIDLPWAQVMNPSHSYGVSGLGVNTQILPGALVFGIFLDGKTSQLPMVLGSVPNIEYPTSVQAAGRDELSTNPFAYDFVQSNSEFQDPVKFGPQNTTSLSSVDAARFFIDNGMSPKQGASLAGTLEAINGLNNNAEGGIAGYPIGTPRYARWISYAQRLKPKKDHRSFDVQLMFVMTELHTSHKTAYAKMFSAKEIEGNLYGENVDGVDKRGNGMVAVLDKYWVHPLTKSSTMYSKGRAEGLAQGIYGALGAR